MTLRKPVAVDATGATRKKYDATRVFGRTCGISQREFDGRIARVSNTRLFPSAEVRRVQLANLNDDFGVGGSEQDDDVDPTASVGRDA